MTWNYRIFIDRTRTDEPLYSICEAHYGDGVLKGYSAPITPQAETLDGMRITLLQMFDALALPVLDAETAVGSPAPPRTGKSARPIELLAREIADWFIKRCCDKDEVPLEKEVHYVTALLAPLYARVEELEGENDRLKSFLAKLPVEGKP